MRRVGIRELRQNLSVHLRDVKRGESLEVTEHGRPVAVLAPLAEPASRRERLIASGQMIPARTSVADLPPPIELPAGLSASDALAEDREERL